MTPAGPDRDIYAETLAVFDRTDGPGEPLTTPEVTESLDCSRRAVYKRLKRLVDRGDLRTKKVGSRARVWWRPIAVPVVAGGGDGPGETASAATEGGDETGDEGAARAWVAASERKFRAVFEEAFDAMLIADDDAAYVDANPAACELFGLPRAELLGRTVREFAAEDYDFDRAWREFQASDSGRGIFPLVRADGERRLVEFAATSDVLPGRHLSIIRDVTEREEHERVLREQRDELHRLDRLNTVIRKIDRSIAHAETRTEVEQAVCESLVEFEHYRCAGIVEFARAFDGSDPAAVAGDDGGVVEALAGEASGGPGDTPAATAIETGRVLVVEGIEESTDRPWGALLVERGFRSLAVVPLVHHGTTYGVIAVASDEPNAFDGRERDLLAELGETVGHAVNALERERALLDEGLLEVRLRSTALAAPFADIEGLGVIRLDQTIPLDGTVVEYLTVEGTTPGAFTEFCDRLSRRSGVRILNRSADAGWIEVRTEPPTVATLAARFGGWARSVEIDDGAVDLVVEVPQGSNVRDLVSTLCEIAPDVEFVGQERVLRRDVTAAGMSRAFDDELTDRQRKTLELAFYAGYFEWPRNTTGEQLAERLGIHPSTLHNHLRCAERKVLAALFDERTVGVDAN